MNNPGHNILELYSVLVQVRFATCTTKLDNKLLNNLRLDLRILENFEILEKP